MRKDWDKRARGLHAFAARTGRTPAQLRYDDYAALARESGDPVLPNGMIPNGAASLVTFQLQGYVAADKSGAVNQSIDFDGSASSDPDGSIATYAWSQTGGTPVVPLSDPASAEPTFLAPTVTSPATLTFSLVVTSGSGANAGALLTAVTVTTN